MRLAAVALAVGLAVRGLMWGPAGAGDALAGAAIAAALLVPAWLSRWLSTAELVATMAMATWLGGARGSLAVLVVLAARLAWMLGT